MHVESRAYVLIRLLPIFLAACTVRPISGAAYATSASIGAATAPVRPESGRADLAEANAADRLLAADRSDQPLLADAYSTGAHTPQASEPRSAGPAPASPTPTPTPTTVDSVMKAVQTLKDQGRYREAADLIHARLLPLLKSGPDADPDKARDAAAMLTILDSMARLGGPETILNAAIENLRNEGNYESALAAARELLSRLHDNPATPAYKAQDCERLIKTFTRATGLSRQDREDLAEADRATQKLHDAYVTSHPQQAEQLARHQAGIRRRLLGEDHPEFARSLHLLARTLILCGRYAEAEPLVRKALAIQREVLGPEHPETATSLMDLGDVLGGRGDLAEKYRLHREALDINRRLGDDRYVYMCAGPLADLAQERGDSLHADSLRVETVELARKIFPPPFDFDAVGQEARLMELRKNPAAAESLYRAALDGRRNLGALRFFDAPLPEGLTALLSERGAFQNADVLLREAIALRCQASGEDTPEIISDELTLARVLESRGRMVDAESVLTRAAVSFDLARVRVGTGMDRATFQQSPYTQLALARYMLDRKPEAWVAAERAQGRALADLMISAHARRLSATEATREDSLRLHLESLEAQLSGMVAPQGEPQGDPEALHNELLKAEADWSAYEEELGRRYPVTEGEPFDLARVQRALRPEEAIVGWVEGDWGTEHYPGCLGYVIRDSGPVRWEPLQWKPEQWEPVQWQSVADGGRGRAGRHRNRAAGSVARSFQAEVSRSPTRDDRRGHDDLLLGMERFGPLLQHLSGVRHLIVIPSGGMLGVPVEALRVERSTFSAVAQTANGGGEANLGDLFAVSYAPSATIYTWLVEGRPVHEHGAGDEQRPERRDNPGSAGTPAHPEGADVELACLAVGDPDPGPAATDSAATQTPFQASLPQLSPATPLPPLPGGRAEIEAVAHCFGPRTRILLGADASEQELTHMARSGELRDYPVILIATHALIDDERPENSALVLSRARLPATLEATLSGERIYDGLLSAGEIVHEWKLDADLATLSACQSGLGKPITGEGYVGLVDAFLQAGARSVLVSLWDVEDRPASMLMQRFYEDWRGTCGSVSQRDGARAGEAMSAGEAMNPRPGVDPKMSAGPGMSSGPGMRAVGGMTKAEALREAKEWLRTRTEIGPDGKVTTPFADPYYWAGFVMVGDGR